MSRNHAHEKFLLIAIIALAAFFRFYRLDELPPGFEFDVAYKTFDVLRLLQGQFAIFFPAYTGREPLFHYLAMPAVAIFGPTAFALKVSAAIIGTATIPLLYGFAREFFRSSRVAALTALCAAISPWHIFFSRAGYRVILLAPLTVLMFWSLWRALSPSPTVRGRAGEGVRDFAFAGLFLGLALYTYPSARVFPLALIALVAFAAWNERARRREYFAGLARALIVTAMVFLPLGIYFAAHPDEFIAHPADVSIFAQHGDAPRDLGAVFIENAARLLGMFFVAGDGIVRNVPGRPVFDPMLAALFLVGVGAFAAFGRQRIAFLVVWIGMALGISALSDDAPNFSRMLFAAPAIMLLPACGASAIWERLRAPMLRRAALAAFGVVMVASAALAFRDYFDVFANNPETYFAFGGDKVEIATWLTQTAPKQITFLAPLLQQDGTIALLTRNAPLKSFDSRDTIVLPSDAAGKDAVFVFPWEQEKKFQTLATRLGALGAPEDFRGAHGERLLLIYRAPASNLPETRDLFPALARGGDFIQPQKIERANWANQIELFGNTISPEGPGGRNLTVTLFLRALDFVAADYTFSIKVRDEKNRVWGQDDKWAGSNSYATTRWDAGDVVIEKFYPGLGACAPAGAYRVTVEAYDPKTMQTLGDAIALGAFRADAAESNRLQDLDPARVIDRPIGTQLRLLGYTWFAEPTRIGENFSLALFWRGVDAASAQSVALKLRDASGRDFTLRENQVKIPGEGRGVCSLYDLTLPRDLEPGAASLWVNDFKVSDLNLQGK